MFKNIIEHFKKEIQLTAEYYKSSQEPGNEEVLEVSIPLDSERNNAEKDNKQINFVPCYYCGHLIRIIPETGRPYSKFISLIYSSNSVISDDISYHLTSGEEIKKIPMPHYEIHGKNSIDKDLGVKGTIEYFLRKKGDLYWESKKYELAFSCYAKATELMIVTDEYWPPEAYDLISNRFLEIGNTELAKKWEDWIDSRLCFSEMDISVSSVKPAKEKLQPLSYTDKERIMVERITISDMRQFNLMPYDLNCPIHKFDAPNSHPYAFIVLNTHNIEIAKTELKRVNDYIIKATEYIPELSKKFCIDVDKIAFSEYSPNYGYTKLICTPYTFGGKISKTPVSLSFMSRLDVIEYQVVGNLDYSSAGDIIKANVNVWRRKSREKPATGWMFIFNCIEGHLSLAQVKSTIKPDKYGMPDTVYRSKQLIEEEKKRDELREEFIWVQENLPDLCPKSLSGYSRMKNANSATYRKISEAAKKLKKT